jgi:NADH-quinone oxidoreductase subunit K
MIIPVHAVILLSHAVFCLGVFGILTRRNSIALLLSIELILNAAAVNFVLFARLYGHVHGQAFALFIIALAACEVVVGLAIVLSLAQHAKTVMADHVRLLKG